VFKIYKDGGGYIRVGNKVGLYYPSKRKWFSCADSNCDAKSCPGAPNWYYGFASREKWGQCTGEVFQIYAYGKSFGAAIKDGDAIMFCYPRERKWVSLHGSRNSAHKQGCPGGTLPPPIAKWDKCDGEVFYITKV